MLAPLSKRRYASVLPDSPPLGALPPDKSAPPITVKQKEGRGLALTER